MSPQPSGRPELIGDYRIERELARGGMGVVFVAVHTQLERQRDGARRGIVQEWVVPKRAR